MKIAWLMLLLGGGALALYLTYRVAFWIAEGKRNLKPGHVSPTPSFVSRQLRWLLGGLMVWLFIGRLYIQGADNLLYYGRLMALGGHQTERDSLVILKMMKNRPLRYFIAVNQASGWRRPLVAYTGGIVVHPGVADSAAALRAAIRAMRLEPESNFIVFPQGKLVPTNMLVRKDFRGGVVVLANTTADQSELEVSYLPFAIYYDRDPEHADSFHRFMNHVGWHGFRSFFGEVIYGAVLVIGAPVPAEVLPRDPDESMDALFEHVRVLSERAEAIGKSGNY